MPDYPRLLFSVRLSEDVNPRDLSAELFTDWLRSIPVSAELVRIEAGFASDSTVLLLSLPVSIIGYLRSDPAITLLGTIRSKNLLITELSEEMARSSELENKELSLKPQHPTFTGTAGTKSVRSSTSFNPISPVKDDRLYRYPSNPWRESENRFILAEAAKCSSVPAEIMFQFIQSENISPSWTEMLLPYGRNLKSCIDAWDNMHFIFTESSTNSSQQMFANLKTSKKRNDTSDDEESSMLVVQKKNPTRRIEPKRRNVTSLREDILVPPPKKRGRPSRADKAMLGEIACAETPPPLLQLYRPKASSPTPPRRNLDGSLPDFR